MKCRRIGPVEWGYLKRHPFKKEVRLDGERGQKARDRYIEDWEIAEALALRPMRKRGSVRRSGSPNAISARRSGATQRRSKRRVTSWGMPPSRSPENTTGGSRISCADIVQHCWIQHRKSLIYGEADGTRTRGLTKEISKLLIRKRVKPPR
jgi:hypothetical protein